MVARVRLMIAAAERQFPVRIRIAADQGLGTRLDQMHQWLDQNAGADGWAMTPSGARGVVNDAAAIYFADATIASAFVVRWCAGYSAEVAHGLFRVREDEPAARKVAAHHKSPPWSDAIRRPLRRRSAGLPVAGAPRLYRMRRAGC
jgi:hypothetical protein